MFPKRAPATKSAVWRYARKKSGIKAIADSYRVCWYNLKRGNVAMWGKKTVTPVAMVLCMAACEGIAAEASKRGVAEVVFATERRKRYAYAERDGVVSHDSRRTTQHCLKTRRRQLSARGHRRGGPYRIRSRLILRRLQPQNGLVFRTGTGITLFFVMEGWCKEECRAGYGPQRGPVPSIYRYFAKSTERSKMGGMLNLFLSCQNTAVVVYVLYRILSFLIPKAFEQ